MRQQQKVLCHVATEDTGEFAIANSAGTVAWRAAFHAFGYAEVDPSSTITNNLRLPGQYFDSETNLHYNWNRYYDPRTGRYLTPDPIGLEGGIDPFVYVENDPVNSKDFTGLAAWASLGAGGFVALGPPGVGADSGFAMDTNGTVCFYTSRCVYLGFNVAGGSLGAVGAGGSGSLCSGVQTMVGGYWYGGSGALGQAQILVNKNGGQVGRGFGGISVPAAAGAGTVVCEVEYHCINEAKSCKKTRTCAR